MSLVGSGKDLIEHRDDYLEILNLRVDKFGTKDSSYLEITQSLIEHQKLTQFFRGWRFAIEYGVNLKDKNAFIKVVLLRQNGQVKLTKQNIELLYQKIIVEKNEKYNRTPYEQFRFVQSSRYGQ